MTTPTRSGGWADLLQTALRALGAADKVAQPVRTWADFLAPHRDLFAPEFLKRWEREPWAPTKDDQKAAAQLHTQIASRITTQRLDYLDGVEKTALDSVYALFQKTRDIADKHPDARHFDALAWEVLNTHVRPFTAKWHRQSERGALSALDATDEFRAGLGQLQPLLQRFDALLVHLRDGQPPPPPAAPSSGRHEAIDKEMGADLPWGIPVEGPNGRVDADTARAINSAERAAIRQRRQHYQDAYGVDPEASCAAGLALSGGGIRSATFGLGVLVALARRGILPQIDYLSTVSGGGYLGSFVSAFLESPGMPPGSGDATPSPIGLGPDQRPFSRRRGESDELRHMRHQSKYLASGSWWQRATTVVAQLYGMALNGLAIVYVIVVATALEQSLRRARFLDGIRDTALEFAVGLLALAAVATLVMLRISRSRWQQAYKVVTLATLLLIAAAVWYTLPDLRQWVRQLPTGAEVWRWLFNETIDADQNGEIWPLITGLIPLLSGALAIIFGPRLERARVLLVLVPSVAVLLFLFGIYLEIYDWLEPDQVAVPLLGTVNRLALIGAILVTGFVIDRYVFDVNSTSPHRYYRDSLTKAYVVQARANGLVSGMTVPLSQLGRSSRSPYHLINCALNVPGSKEPYMQGRLTDFFLFSADYCGSPLIGYFPTAVWERRDPHLDLGTAMAISGAAAAPQMGLGTMRQWSFWLTLMNVRLGYWVPNPTRRQGRKAPGLVSLAREMLGNMHEKLSWLNLTDGGHIENLGIYELLRRRCKYIIAIDGEEDAKMTFHGLTTLLRMAHIDLGIDIELDLDDLRVNDKGLSRSHFRFCRIRYRATSPEQIGYLLYVKLSLTGNEGEFIRRYRLDEPVFPHHSTADQLFSEAQFEAYRALGEHVGDKLFLRPLVDDLGVRNQVPVDEWFLRLGRGLLERRAEATT